MQQTIIEIGSGQSPLSIIPSRYNVLWDVRCNRRDTSGSEGEMVGVVPYPTRRS